MDSIILVQKRLDLYKLFPTEIITIQIEWFQWEIALQNNKQASHSSRSYLFIELHRFMTNQFSQGSQCKTRDQVKST